MIVAEHKSQSFIQQSISEVVKTRRNQVKIELFSSLVFVRFEKFRWKFPGEKAH